MKVDISRPLLVSIDIGRSAIKCQAQHLSKKNKSFTCSFTVPTVVLEGSSDLSAWDFNTSYCTISGIDYLIGETALNTQSNDTLELGESSTYHQYAITIIQWAIANSLHQFELFHKSDYSPTEVYLSIALTSDSMSLKSWYSNALKRKHSVTLYPNSKPKRYTFTVRNLFAFHQGHASLLTSLEDNLHTNSSVLVVDIGRYTVDFCLVNSLTLSRHSSVSLGSKEFLPTLIQLLRTKGIQISPYLLEKALREHTDLQSLDTLPISPAKLAIESSKDWFSRIDRQLTNFLSGAVIDSLYLCGGGSAILRPHFKAKYPSIKQNKPIYNPDFSNVLGMATFLRSQYS